MNFGQVIEALKRGKKAARQGWNGKGMWICLFSSLSLGIKDEDNHCIDFIFNDEELGDGVFSHITHFDGEIEYKLKDCFCMFTANKEIQLGWLASQPDMLANDWIILEY